MFTRYLLLAALLLAGLATFAPRLIAQSPPPPPNPYGSGYVDIPGYPGKPLYYTLEYIHSKELGSDGKWHQKVGVWFKFENKDYENDEFDFIVCCMINFQGSEDQMHCSENKFTMSKNPGTKKWECLEHHQSLPLNNISFHFGCIPVHVGKKGSLFYVLDGYYDLPEMICDENPEDEPFNPDLVHKNLELSETKDNNPNTWDYGNFYMDFLKGSDGCTYDPATCPGMAFQSNTGLTIVNMEPGTTYNQWQGKTARTRRGNDNPPTSIVDIMAGNWITMEYMANYPARLVGRLYGAPTGTVLGVIHPRDTIGTDSTIDYDTTSFVVTPQLGCAGDSIAINIPFMITPFGGYTSFQLQLPNNACGNTIANGSVIQFIGRVEARDSSAFYDSSDVMYGINVPYLYDTTKPTVSSVTTTVVTTKKLRIKAVGSEDVSMVVGAWIRYRVNGGSEQTFFLRYEDSAVGGSTAFLDTLVLPVDSATVTFRTIMRNTLGLLDTSAVDTCAVYAPALGVETPAGIAGGVRLYHAPNPVDGVMTISVEVPHPMKVTLAMYDPLGRRVSTMLRDEMVDAHRTVRFDTRGLAPGVYRYVLRSDRLELSRPVVVE